MDQKLLNQINTKLAEFCFNHGTDLIQFAISRPATATVLPAAISYTINEPKYGSDDYQSWYMRAHILYMTEHLKR